MFFFKVSTHTATLNKISLACGITVGFLFGGWTQLLTAFLMLQGLDILTGLLTGAKNKDVSSSVMHDGVKKKIGSWIGLILAHVIDIVLFDGQNIAITGLSFVMIGNEGISIVENLSILGVPIPEFITKYLKQIRDYNNKTENKLEDSPQFQ